MAEQTDHDILVRNTTITEQMSKQLGEALQQLARGNERFSQQDSRIASVEHRVTSLETQIVDGTARLREDLLRAVVQSAELKKNSVDEAVRPIQADLVPIKDFIQLTHKIVQGFVSAFKWALSIATAVIIAYLIWRFGLS